jgi:hypothetical protein
VAAASDDGVRTVEQTGSAVSGDGQVEAGDDDGTTVAAGSGCATAMVGEDGRASAGTGPKQSSARRARARKAVCWSKRDRRSPASIVRATPAWMGISATTRTLVTSATSRAHSARPASTSRMMPSAWWSSPRTAARTLR